MTKLTQTQQTAIEEMITRRMETTGETREETKENLKELFTKLLSMAKKV